MKLLFTKDQDGSYYVPQHSIQIKQVYQIFFTPQVRILCVCACEVAILSACLVFISVWVQMQVQLRTRVRIHLCLQVLECSFTYVLILLTEATLS